MGTLEYSLLLSSPVCVHSEHGEQQEIPRQLHNPYQYNGADYDKEAPRGDIQLEEREEEGKRSCLLQVILNQATVITCMVCYSYPKRSLL